MSVHHLSQYPRDLKRLSTGLRYAPIKSSSYAGGVATPSRAVVVIVSAFILLGPACGGGTKASKQSATATASAGPSRAPTGGASPSATAKAATSTESSSAPGVSNVKADSGSLAAVGRAPKTGI